MGETPISVLPELFRRTSKYSKQIKHVQVITNPRALSLVSRIFHKIK